MWPNINPKNPSIRSVDLTGDGGPDFLLTEEDGFSWYLSLGQRGYGSVGFAYADNPHAPNVSFSNPEECIYLADMSDALPDILRVFNGNVCYWPNLGDGRFGGKVSMDNAPVFDSD